MAANILLLESDKQLAHNYGAAFSLKGYKVTRHSDLQNAILATDKLPPDLIIIDLMLAGRSGIEFLYELRSYPEWQAIPVIAMGRLRPDEQTAFAAAFRQLNIGAYLHKPATTFAQLLSHAEALLQPVTA